MGEGSLIKTRKFIVSIDRNIDRVLTVLFLIILLLGIYFAYDSYYVFNSSGLNALAGYRPENGNTGKLKELSADVVAWILIDDTSIDYPVMQGETNAEYLNKNAYGDYSLSGAIFLDSNNASDFSDDYNILYGHHMAGGFMFGAIDAFENKEYFEKHRTGLLTTIDGAMYDINLFAFVETDASESVVFDLTDKGDLSGFIRDNAKVYFEEYGKTIALSTCKSPLTTERTVLFGILTDHVEPPRPISGGEPRGSLK